jgi:hypothetical protein
VAVFALFSPTSRSTVFTSESPTDVAAFSRATAEIYYIKEGGRDEQIEGVRFEGKRNTVKGG